MLLRDFFIALFTYCFIFIMASIAYYLVQNQMAVDNARTDIASIVSDFYTIILVFLLTMIVLSTLQNIRQKVQALYVQYYAQNSAENALNVLKLRTLLVKGTQNIDLSGEKLRRDFEAAHPDGDSKVPKILAMSMIPDFKQAYETVMSIKEMRVLSKVYKQSELNCLTKLILPNKVKDEAIFNIRSSQLERKAEGFLSQDLKNAGSAFICFSSFSAMKQFENFIRPLDKKNDSARASQLVEKGKETQAF